MTPCPTWSRWTSATFLQVSVLVPLPPAPRGAVPRVGPLGPKRGWFFQFYWPVTSYLVTNLTVTFFWVLFFVLNRTTVVGRKNVGGARNTLLLANHQSMLDSFLVGLGAFYPQSWWRPHLIPWNPAAAENFYRTPILAWRADNGKCIWVREGRRALHAPPLAHPDALPVVGEPGQDRRPIEVHL